MHKFWKVATTLMTALTVVCVPAAASADSALTWQDCGDGLRCGQLGVPADWARPGGGERITLGLAMLPAVDQAHKKGTLLVNLGGPAPQIDAFRAGRAAFADLARKFDVVVFDPRGFGRSSGISCPAPAPHTEAWAYPDRASYTTYVAKNRRFGRECTAAAGPLAGHVNSWQTAHDMDAIRAALDEPELTYFGTSYGTVLGQAYVELFPDRVGRMYLDSVRDHTNRSVLDGLLSRARALERNLHRFASWCRDEKTCALHGQDVVALWDELIVKAGKEPIPAPGAGPEVTVNASFIVSRAWFSLEPRWPRLAEALAQASQGDASLLAQPIPSPPSDFSRIAVCADFPYPTAYGKVKAMEAQLRRVAPRVGWRYVWVMANQCGGLPPVRSFAPHPIKAAGVPPILISNGEYDDHTPPSEGRRLAAQLPGARYLPADGGHSLYLSGQSCVRRHVNQYLLTGRLPAEGSTCSSS